MGKTKYYHYFVEGENEEKIIKVLKTDLRWIVPGKVQRFNVVEQKLTKLRLMSLKPETTVILIFDTDTGNPSILYENMMFLQRERNVKNVLCIPQVKNLEDELKRSCNIRQIRELTSSKSNSDFKRDLITECHFAAKLRKYQFDFGKFWTSTDSAFQGITNDAPKIKLIK